MGSLLPGSPASVTAIPIVFWLLTQNRYRSETESEILKRRSGKNEQHPSHVDVSHPARHGHRFFPGAARTLLLVIDYVAYMYSDGLGFFHRGNLGVDDARIRAV